MKKTNSAEEVKNTCKLWIVPFYLIFDQLVETKLINRQKIFKRFNRSRTFMNSQKETSKLMKKTYSEDKENKFKLEIVPWSQIHDHIVETKRSMDKSHLENWIPSGTFMNSQKWTSKLIKKTNRAEVKNMCKL